MQDGGGVEFSGAFGAGLVTIGAAYGISRLASSALESMARQPEVAGNLQTAMIIAAALIEGFTFYAMFICMPAKPVCCSMIGRDDGLSGMTMRSDGLRHVTSRHYVGVSSTVWPR